MRPHAFLLFPHKVSLAEHVCLVTCVTHWARGCRVYREGGVVWGEYACGGVRGKAFASTIDEGQAD